MKTILPSLLAIMVVMPLAAANNRYPSPNFRHLLPSPEVESLCRFADYRMSSATGLPSIRIPIYEVVEGNLVVPISIGYNGALKVGDRAGVIGLEWTLMAGASISRSVNGLPDEMLEENGMMRGLFHLTNDDKKLRNYVRQKPYEYDYAIANSKYVKYISKYCQPYEEGRLDVANDVLHIAGMGLDGTFIYDDNKRMVLQSDDYLRFENGNVVSGTYPGRYEVVDGKGTRYYFEETESSVYEYLYYYRRPQNPDLQNDKYKFTSAWHITKIKSMQGDSIMFEYQDVGERRYKIEGIRRYEDCFDSDYIRELAEGTSGEKSYIDYYPKLLKRIETDSEIVEFEYDKTLPVWVGAVTSDYDYLSQIVVFRKNSEKTKIKTFKFEQAESPFKNRRGGLLSKIVVASADGQTEQTMYSFDYDRGYVPEAYQYSQDHWGYYNGASNGNLLTDQFEHPLASYRCGNREPNAMKAAVGILTKITYPTGGYTSFDWEGNDYRFVNGLENKEKEVKETTPVNFSLCGRKRGENLERTIVVNEPTDMKIDVSDYFSMFESLGHLNGDDGWKDYNNSHTAEYSPNYPSVKVVDAKGNVCGAVFIDRENSGHANTVSVKSAGQYTIRISNPRNIDLSDLKEKFDNQNSEGDFGIVKVSYVDVKKRIVSADKACGGLRIRRIASYSNDDTRATVVRTYKYTDTYDGLNKSSGVVPYEPEYAYHFIMGGHVDGGLGDDIATVYGTSSSGLPTTASGYHEVLYYRIFETEETDSGNVVTQYDFSTYRNTPDVLDMAFYNCGPTNNRIYTSKFYQRGDLLHRKVFDTTGSSQYKMEDYEYTVIEGDSGDFTGDFVKIADFSHLMFKEGQDLTADYTMSKYQLTPYIKRNVRATVSESSATGVVSTTTSGNTYFTDAYSSGSNLCHLKRSDWTYDSRGRRQETFYTYFERKSNLCDSKVTVCDGTIIEAIRMEFDSLGRLVKTYSSPTGIAYHGNALGGTPDISDDLTELINIPEYEYQYDGHGNIIQVCFKGAVVASYLWGYYGRHPIVEALNTDYAQLIGMVESLGFNRNSLFKTYDEQTLTNLFSSLRAKLPNTNVTTMKYDWLTGVSEVTDSSGKVTRYTYDALGRLDAEKDADQRFIKKYVYKYRQP